MSKKQTKLHILYPDKQIAQLLDHASIILDTNILINIAREKEAYIQLYEILIKFECTLATMDLCVFEYLKGSVKKNIIDQKKQTIPDLAILKCKDYQEDYEKIILKYKHKSSKISIADLFLAAALEKHKKNPKVFLLTCDIKDFPNSFFSREIICNIEEEDKIDSIIFARMQE